MFAPEHAAVATNEGCNLVGDDRNPLAIRRVAQVEGWSYVDHASIYVPEHATSKTVAIEQFAKLRDERGQRGRRYGAILHEWDWPAASVDGRQESHAARSERPDSILLMGIETTSRAGTLNCANARSHVMDRLGDLLPILTGKLNEQD